ncbi:MAG TPA: NADH-quinone oxidoreductase subunit M [Rhodanobacteraceae bacterium]
MNHILSLLIWLPMLGAIPVLIARNSRAMRWIALAFTLATFVASLFLLPSFNADSAAMQFVESCNWIPALDVHYSLGVDGISVALILLSTIIGPLVIIGAWEVIKDKASQYMACMLVLEGLLIGVFCATDALLFYVFFEAMLIPMFIIIGVWGGERRLYATMKFFIYTFFGSIFFLITLLYMHHVAGTFNIQQLAAYPFTMQQQEWMFFGFALGFAIKVPMVPVHTWLPDAHVQAPTGGSVWLAAVMLKVGTYGFLRFPLIITPDASYHFRWLIIVLSLIPIVYIGYVALVQKDMKKLVAYSSIAHMAFVTLGFFIAFILVRDFNNIDAAELGMQGALVQMISHGFVSGAMFACIGVMYDRLHTHEIAVFGGLNKVMPWFGFFFVFFAMANCGLPGTSGFVGEFMVILASFSTNPWVALVAAFALIIGAGYTLYLVKRIIFGDVVSERVAKMKDINFREALVLTVLGLMVLAIGIDPEPLIHLMGASVHHLIGQLAVVKV